MTDPLTQTAWPSANSLAGQTVPRVSLTRRAAAEHGAGTQPSGPLDWLLLALSWPRPCSYELAASALVRLRETEGALAACDDMVLAVPGRRRALAGLRARIGFVLVHWESELAGLDVDTWDPARADALAADLTEIARTGAAIRDLIATSTVSARPHPPHPTPVSGGYLRRGEHPYRRTLLHDAGVPPARPGDGAPVAPGKQPPGAARLLRQAVVIVTAVAIVVTVVCYASFDDAGPGSHAPSASASPSPRSAQRAAARSSTQPSVIPGRALPDSAPSSPGTASALQIQLLGASAAQPHIEVLVYLDATSTAPITLQISYRAEGDAHATDATRAEAGGTAYQIAFAIDAAAYCGRPVLVAASAGGLSASQSTSAGPCPASASAPQNQRSET